MKPISWQRWAATFAILLVLSFLADYFFLHILFDPTHRPRFHRDSDVLAAPVDPAAEPASPPPSDPSANTPAADVPPPGSGASVAPENAKDNFLASLQECRGDISAQGITTPEALMNYLDRSIGKSSESVEIENYIFFLPDGSERRVHLVLADDTNSKDKRELRYFEVDREGYPQRIELTPEQKRMSLDDLKKSLVSQGNLRDHQVKSTSSLRDGSFLNLETRNDKIYEFQWRGNNPGDHTLSCRQRDCLCR